MKTIKINLNKKAIIEQEYGKNNTRKTPKI
jgi:hypothetical protein